MIEAFLIAIATLAGTAFAGWLLDRWLGIRRRVGEWRDRSKQRGEQRDAMYEGFGPLRDSVAATQDTVGRLTGQLRSQDLVLAEQNKVLGTLLAMTLSEFESSVAAKFICDPSGRNENVNASYTNLLNVDRDDLLGFRWRSFIQTDSLAAHIARFEQANQDHRKYEDEIVMRKSDGAFVRLKLHMLPFPPDIGPATHWVGMLTLVDE